MAVERLAQWASFNARPLAVAGWAALRVLARRLPGPVMEGFARGLRGPDRRLANEPRVREALVITLLEGLRQGSAATVDDYAIEGRPWGFDLAQIRVPVLLWHGDLDDEVPLAHARWLAERIPGASLEIVEGAGHLMIGRVGPIAASLQRSATPRTA